ncbi:hypothetical protein B0H14DRAFT_3143414 [Mycena olivaceomarginata]|nr:hypothetical protein B0H14DRAFT_3143414 [Mycena olivaceomarginata]
MAFYVQVIRKRGLGRNRLLASATIALFVLCTAHCVLVLAAVATAGSWGMVVVGQPTGDLSLDEIQLGLLTYNLSLAANIVYVTNILADAIFVRTGYFNVSFEVMNSYQAAFLSNLLWFDVTIGVSLFTTFILMGLTVGRIWMLARTARRVLGAELTGTYHTVCAMILESGALYLCGGTAFIVLAVRGPLAGNITSVRHASATKIDTILIRLFRKQTEGVVLAQLVGIAPTIIAVRVALGQSVENVNSFIVPRPRVRSPFHQEACATALDPVDDEVLYIREHNQRRPSVLF